MLVLTIITLPGLLASLVSRARKPSEQSWAMHAGGIAASAARQFAQIGLTLAFPPHDAFISLDAIGRTLLRLLITHKRLLEWQTSSDAERKSRADLLGFYASMWVAPAMALAVGLFLALRQPAPLIPALPILTLWLFAPWIAWWISQPLESPAPDLTDGQTAFLRETARKTWHFFEVFVTAQDHWLPPDNVQEVPIRTIASRTSPTNMGLALLANLAARDSWLSSRGRTDPAHTGRARRHAATGAHARPFPPTTGTIPARSSRCCPCTCPAWTAATWPGIC